MAFLGSIGRAGANIIILEKSPIVGKYLSTPIKLTPKIRSYLPEGTIIFKHAATR